MKLNGVLIGCILGVLLTGCHRDEIQVVTIKNPKSTVDVISQPQASLTWKVPAGWKSLPVTLPRLASFEILVSDRVSEMSVTSFPGDTGGLLANVNRWRSQLDLPAVEASQLSDFLTVFKSDSFQFKLLRLTAGDRGMQVAILSTSDQTWFFKLTGKSRDLDFILPQFKQFLSSVSLRG